jgi:hypothetical protein
VIDDVWQITGVADVMRGQSDPDETAAAQGIKAHWGSLRVRDRQKEIERFARDLLRIIGEVIASKFSPETLGQMAGVQLLTAGQKAQIQMQIEAQGVIAQVTGRPPPPVPPQLAAQLAQPSWDEVMALLQNRATRMFRIDVESDSTILPDEQLEKQRRVEFVHAIGEFLGQSLPAVRATPQLFPVISESLKFLVRGFRAGREMEEVIERALDELQQASGEGDPGQPPGGEADRVKAEAAQLQGRAALMKAGTDQQRAAVQARAVELEHQAAMAAVAAENARTAAQAHVGLHDARLRHHADLHGALLQAARAGGPPGAAPPPGM